MHSSGKPPLHIAIIGMGGFAGAHHRAWQTLETAGEGRVICTCDPQSHNFQEQIANWHLSQRGVHIYNDYLQMLDAHAHELDMVVVPTPVPLHAPMHRAVIERGLACYLEKPPTLFYAELDEMLAVEANAHKSTNVGFNFIIETTRQSLKTRILNGEFGRVQRVGFIGFWPRASTYFTRATWAGRLMMDERPVLDSCVGNAMAHYIHNLHFWCGLKDIYDWEPFASIEAELYRAHSIENFDTCFARGLCGNGIEFIVAATHAAQGQQYQREWVECEKATITYVTHQDYHIAWKDGREERGEIDKRDLLLENCRAYLQYLRGAIERPITSLTDARPFVLFNNLIYIAAQVITQVPEDYITRTPTQNGDGQWVAINHIQEALETFVTQRQLPSEQNREWGRAGGKATLAELPHLLQVVQRMQKESNLNCYLPGG